MTRWGMRFSSLLASKMQRGESSVRVSPVCENYPHASEYPPNSYERPSRASMAKHLSTGRGRRCGVWLEEVVKESVAAIVSPTPRWAEDTFFYLAVVSLWVLMTLA